jgi:hypothetical protein
MLLISGLCAVSGMAWGTNTQDEIGRSPFNFNDDLKKISETIDKNLDAGCNANEMDHELSDFDNQHYNSEERVVVPTGWLASLFHKKSPEEKLQEHQDKNNENKPEVNRAVLARMTKCLLSGKNSALSCYNLCSTVYRLDLGGGFQKNYYEMFIPTFGGFEWRQNSFSPNTPFAKIKEVIDANKNSEKSKAEIEQEAVKEGEKVLEENRHAQAVISALYIVEKAKRLFETTQQPTQPTK